MRLARLPAGSVPLLGVLLVAAGILALQLVGGFVAGGLGPDNPDAEDYAQQARALADGEGLTSDFAGLNTLLYLKAHGYNLSEAWPAVSRYPTHRLYLAGVFGALGASDRSLVLATALLYLPTVALTYLLGRRLGGETAGVVAGLIAASSGLLSSSLSGMSEAPMALLQVTVLYALCRRPTPRLALFVGVATALIVLAKYNHVVLLGPVLLYCALVGRPRGRTALGFALGAALLLVPWLAWTWQVARDPLYLSILSSGVYAGLDGGKPVNGWYLLAPACGGAGIPCASPSLLGKLALGLARSVLLSVPAAVGHPWPWVLWPLVAAGGLWAWRLHRGWTVLWLLLFAAVLATTSAVQALPRHYLMTVPGIAAVIGTGVARPAALLRRWRLAPVVFCLVVVLLCADLDGALRRGLLPAPPPDAAVAYVDRSGTNEAHLRQTLPPDSLVASNLAWSVAWQAQRRALPIPPTPSDLPTMEDALELRVDAIYLTPNLSIDNAPDSWYQWDEVRRGIRMVPGYCLDRVFLDGARLLLRCPDS